MLSLKIGLLMLPLRIGFFDNLSWDWIMGFDYGFEFHW